MKRLLILFLSTTCLFILSGCAGEEATNKTSKNNNAEQKEVETIEMKSFELYSKIDQLGEESFEHLDKNTYVTEKDGYTYVITPFNKNIESVITYSNPTNDALYVSVIKDNKIIVKEKEVDLSSIYKTTLGFRVGFDGTNILMVSAPDEQAETSTTMTTEFVNAQLHNDGSITIGEVKNYKAKDAESILYAQDIEFIEGKRGTYVLASNNEVDMLLEPKTWKQINTGEVNGEYFINEDKDYIYSRDRDEAYVYTYDYKNNDYVWAKDGSKQPNYMSDRIKSFAFTDGGFYGIDRVNYKDTETQLAYHEYQEEGHISMINQTLIESALPMIESGVQIVLNDKYVNVYTLVNKYKGKPAIQKYSYTRVDN